MVKDIFKKIITDWYLWLGLAACMQFFKMGSKLGWFAGIPFLLIFFLRVLSQGGFWVAIMYRWKFPKSWLGIYILTGVFLDYFNIIPMIRFGFVLLFLGYYFLERGRGQRLKG